MSRGHNEFLAKLFEQHVTEIYDGIVEIKAVARDPGLRSRLQYTQEILQSIPSGHVLE